MKRLLVAGLLLLAASGVRAETPELARFGYVGVDAEADTNRLFFVTPPCVTNWVPARVLCVCEDYEFSADERALLAAAGVVTPGEPLAEVPAGYGRKYDEPWFVGWERPAGQLTFEGAAGFLGHFDEDSGVWQTGNSYFSSYWDDAAAARAALGRLKGEVAKFRPMTFHGFADGWVAEYVRLLVIAVVGRREDGTWSCMLEFKDKRRGGCGEWVPVAEQRKRLADYRYGRAMKAWREASSQALSDNRAAVARARAERGLGELADGFSGYTTGDWRQLWVKVGGFGYVVPETADATTNAMEAAWSERRAFVETVSGAKLDGPVETGRFPDGYDFRSATGSNELYEEIRLDVAYPTRDMELPEGGTLPTNGGFRVILVERTQPGVTLPPHPVREL